MQEPCPHCGEPIARSALSCRHCGSDYETGWAHDLDYHEVEIPEYLLPEREAPDAGVTTGRRIFDFLAIILLLLTAMALCELASNPLHWRVIVAGVFALWLLTLFLRRGDRP